MFCASDVAGAEAKVIPFLRTEAGAIFIVPAILISSGTGAFRNDFNGIISILIMNQIKPKKFD